jgi:hypothetical protein
VSEALSLIGWSFMFGCMFASWLDSRKKPTNAHVVGEKLIACAEKTINGLRFAPDCTCTCESKLHLSGGTVEILLTAKNPAREQDPVA